MTIDALDNYNQTKIAEGKFPKMAEVNKGKPKLDPQEEYVFQLVERDVNEKAKGFKKETEKEAPIVTKVYLLWEELTTKNRLVSSYRIDTISWGNPDGTMKSGAVQFLEDIGQALTKPKEGESIRWGNKFMIGMKIHARAELNQKDGILVPDEYRLKKGSARKYQV
jgi:hypothetical protein